MRLLAFALLAGCTAPAVPASPPKPAAGEVTDTTTISGGVEHRRIEGHAVSLDQLPIAEWVGLPMRGTGSIDVDLRVPIASGARDWSRADGTIALTCTACQLGDDVAKLDMQARDRRTSAFAGDGVAFGHLAFDSIDVALKLGGGRVEVTQWKVASPDVEIEVRFAASLLAGSPDVDGCVRFKPAAALAQREPKTYAALQITGAPIAKDGMFNIRLAGPLGAMRRLGNVCDGSAPYPPADVAVVDVGTKPELPAPVDDDDDSLAKEIDRGITKVDATHYTITKGLVDKLTANPMAMAKGARVVPAVANGKPNGFKLYAIKPGSVFAKLGLENGDTLTAINGFSLDSADRALEVYTKLRDATQLEIDIIRRGKALSIDYTIQ